MNAHVQTFKLVLEGNEVEEAVTSIFHTVLFYRTCGKSKFLEDNLDRSEGTIGYTDVDCQFIDFTYVRCSSVTLDHNIREKVSLFVEQLRQPECFGSGEISLKFYRKKKTIWPFNPTVIPWEVWNVQLDLMESSNVNECPFGRGIIEEVLSEKIVSIAEFMNNNHFMPDIPCQEDLCLIFDMSYKDCQPYLYDIVFNTSNSRTTSLGSVFWNMF